MRDALIIGATAAVFAVVNVVAWRWQMHRIDQAGLKPEHREPFRLFRRK
jgi:hypothetical protein